MSGNLEAVLAYIRTLRSKAKQEYAWQYAEFLANGEPEGKEPERNELSYMAAQAVRLNLRSSR